MLLLNRDKLKQRVAESLESPDFIALTTLDAGDGINLPLEVRINEIDEPLKVELTRSQDGKHLDYVLTNGHIYKGKVVLRKEEGQDPIAEVYLDKFDGKRVSVQQGKKGKPKVMYGQNGGLVPMTKDDLELPNYWLPTIINHLCKHADDFLRPFRGEGGGEGDDPANGYWLKSPQHSPRTTPSEHFRRSCVHKKEDGDGSVMTTSVTGCYVNANWAQYTQDQIVASIAENAAHIKPNHLVDVILPAVERAKRVVGVEADAIRHTLDAVRQVYETAVTD